MATKSKSHKQNRILGSALLITGMAISLFGVTDLSPIRAQLLFTEQGSVLGTVKEEGSRLLPQAVVLPAAPEQDMINAGLVAFGALMMLLGFGLHALMVLRMRNERPVPIRSTSRVKAFPRTSRKQMEVIWVERTIRL